MVTLPVPRSGTEAGISADGSVVVGGGLLKDTPSGDFHSRAFRWTQAGDVQNLGTIAGYLHSRAAGVSADGTVVVGSAFNNADELAFRWTQTGGMAGLGMLAGSSSSSAKAVSADGSVVVGSSKSGAISQAFRWTQAGGMMGLGTLSGYDSSAASAVSEDGAVVVGSSGQSGSGTTRAMRWTAATGMQTIEQWLADNGMSTPIPLNLTEATGTNADGSVVVGNSLESQAWLARAGSGVLTDLSAFNASLIESGIGNAGGVANLVNLTLFGSHHRSLLNNGWGMGGDRSCAWATADTAGYAGSGSRTNSFEVGACTDLGPVRVGLGLGKARSRRDWSLGGEGKVDGEYLVAEVAGAFGEHLQGSLLGYRGDLDVDARRRYLNGRAVDLSTAQFGAKASALRARLDWNDAAALGGFGISPYAVYSWTRIELDAHTETGGGFPARYDASDWSSRDLRLGIAADTALSDATDLGIAIEGVHRLDDANEGVSGAVVGLFGFGLPGERAERNWARATIDLDHRFSERSLLSLGVQGASSGQDAEWGVSASYRHAF